MNLVNRPAAVRAVAFHQILFSPETLIRSAVPAGVFPFFDLSPVPEHLEKSLHGLDVCVIGCPDKCVIGYVQPFPEIPEIVHHDVCMFLRGAFLFRGCLFNLLAMFVCACKKENFFPCNLLNRARISAAMVVYAWPMCGISLT